MIRVVTCEPHKKPKNDLIADSIESTIEFLGGYFEVLSLSNCFLLYRRIYNQDILFNRMVEEFPVFGNFFISKMNRFGIRCSLSNEEAERFLESFVKSNLEMN